MTLAQSTLINRIRRHVKDFPVIDTGTLANAADTTLVVTSTTNYSVGQKLEFIEDGDIFQITEITNATTLTGLRDVYGSTAAAHSSAAFYIEPRYYRLEIIDAISAVIQERLWPFAWKAVADTVTPTPASGTRWYDLAAAARGLISVRQLYGNSLMEGRYGPTYRYRRRALLQRNMTTSLVASGVGITFPDGYYHDSNTINIDYAAKITDTLTSTTYDDFSDGDAVVEAIVYGAVAQLEAALENAKPRRPRQDRETLRGAALYDRKFENALDRAYTELMHTIPIMARSKIG